EHFLFPYIQLDFEEAANLMDANRDVVTISIGDEDLKAKRQGPAGGFPPDVADDDPLGSDDKTEVRLLAGQKKSAPFWTFEYYQAFFDVETHHVKERIIGSMLPWPGKNFIQVYLRKNPDLYVTIAATAIFTYAWLVPLGLWGFLLWRNNKILNLVSYSFMEIICVYGYSLSVYIPAVVLWIIQVEWLRWCFMVVALCVSGSVLVTTFWPAVRDDNPRVTIAVIAIILLLNALLAVGCKLEENIVSDARIWSLISSSLCLCYVVFSYIYILKTYLFMSKVSYLH
uniref:Yip1 domain family, member 1 n=1 Tax=Nothobranchius furzeri TaxID=105023 RepID=A0A8C6PH60_NOTFU